MQRGGVLLFPPQLAEEGRDDVQLPGKLSPDHPVNTAL